MNIRHSIKSLAGLALAIGAINAVAAESVIYNDTFQSYPAVSPAPSPLVGGPAGGQWFFVDPTPPTIAANEHRIFESGSAGSGLQSRVWISSIDNCKITNAITISGLPSRTNSYRFTLSFMAATDTTTLGRRATFYYEVGSSSGQLQFVSGGNQDASQTFTGLSGYGIAPEGSGGKTSARLFQVVFSATNITTADKIFVALQRITNAGASGAFIALDDVSLSITEEDAPQITQQPVSQSVTAGSSVTISAGLTNVAETVQWHKDGQPVTGATSASYTISFVTKADEGSYVLWATNANGYVSSSPATLTVTDAAAPTLVSATGLLTLQHALIRFSEPVQEESATNTANYGISGGSTISAARLTDRFTVELLTTSLNPNTSYTVTVSGVQDLAGLVINPGSTVSFTTPNMLTFARYDAGTTATQPAGPPNPTSLLGGYWTHTTNLNPGMTTNAIIDDNSTGLNAWVVSDQSTIAGGGLDYRLIIDTPTDNMARSNGWRLLVRSRLVNDIAGSGAAVVLYSHPGAPRRYGITFDLNADGNLTAALIGGGTYVITSDPTGYHTHTMVFDPATGYVTYYVDGVLIATNYTGDANTTFNGLVFGTGSTGGTGEMNFNLIQLDAVNSTQPVIVAQPQTTTNGVGQKVTFTAEFTPFVASYQWLSNNVIVYGANSNSYTTDFITLGMNGTQYRCRALSALGNVESAIATLYVTSDTQPPTVAEAKGSLLLDRATITFSEPVLPLYATNIANYVWVNPGMTTLSARMVDSLTVELRTSLQNSDSNYTVKVSNVRDTSNLVIANNTPASFKTAKLNTLAKYDAGSTTTRPLGPPDPTSVDGGSWLFSIGTDPLLTTNAIADDFGTGLHAWQVNDQNTSGTAQLIAFNVPLTADQNAAIRANGWVMTVRSRFDNDFGSSFSVISQYGDQSGSRQLLWYDLDGSWNLVVRLQGGADYTLTTDGSGTSAYHLHQVVYNPATTNASYYFDGEFVATWAGDVSPYTYAGVQWGTGSTANQGAMNFNLVEFKAVEAPALPYVAVARNGANIDVSYTGVLEAATALAPANWAPVATNSTPGTNIFSVPATGQVQQFFRSRPAQ